MRTDFHNNGFHVLSRHSRSQRYGEAVFLASKKPINATISLPPRSLLIVNNSFFESTYTESHNSHKQIQNFHVNSVIAS